MGFEITVGKEGLLEQLNKNKIRYVDTREVLVAVYKEKVEEYQKEYAEYSQRVIDSLLTEDDNQPFPPHIPEDRTETYEQYITMVTCHCGDTLVIEDKMFNQLYHDKWAFIREHIAALNLWADDFESGTIDNTSTSTAAALMAYTG